MGRELSKSQPCVFVAKKASGCLGCLGQSFANLQGKGSPSGARLELCVPCWVPQYKRNLELLGQAQLRTTKMIRGVEHLSGDERLRQLGLFGLEKKRLRGDLINVQKCLKGGCPEDGTGLFLVVLSNGMRGNGQKQKQRNFHLNTSKAFITVRETQQRDQF